MSTLRYAVRVDAPQSHLAEIELRFAPTGDTIDLTLPAWCPGSYLIRDYARFVRDLEVKGDDGRPRPVHKVDKQTWRVARDGATELTVRYGLYGNDLTVRTNHIGDDHAFLHGPATFMFPVDMRGEPCDVELHFPTTWELTSAAQSVGELSATIAPRRRVSGSRIHARSIDELYDHPIHLGVVRVYALPSSVPAKLAIWGQRSQGGPFDEQRLVADLGAIVDDHVKRLGVAPFTSYTFILMLSHDAYGGLEHRASSVNLYNPHFAQTRKSYEGLLELLSHELFHAWNGKRIAPRPLLEFDYTREAYTPCLWVMEGITSHYDRFALRSSGRISGKSYLEKVLDDYARLMATPGRARQSLEQSSFDAWIKLYKPDESNLNTTVSYYLKGGLVMFALDLQIRRRTEGARSLDDVLRLLWERYGSQNEPHPDELQPIFEEASGLGLGDVFARQIRGTEDPDLREELAYVGLELRASADPAATGTEGAHGNWLGLTVAGNKVSGVFDGSPAQKAGITPGDELIAIDTFRTANDSDLRSLIANRKPGETVAISLFRRHRLVELPCELAVSPPTRYEIATVADAGPAAARYQAWLGEPHPGASQILATITTTARWV
jgi:predicted metalloprotease with PDZ domain